MITTLCVVAVGAINGILIAVALALVRFVKQTARPRAEVLGKVDGLPGFLERHRSAKTFPGLTLFRFNAPLTFFNADYFKQRALAEADAAGPDLQWFVIDAIPISDVDINGLYAMRDLREALETRGAARDRPLPSGTRATHLSDFASGDEGIRQGASGRIATGRGIARSASLGRDLKELLPMSALPLKADFTRAHWDVR
jgi:MFS superfamily sulfate permease-like transporter